MDDNDQDESDLDDIGFECPLCRSHDYSTWAFPHPLIVHWVLNPGLVVNELLLGQRIPTITYFCSQCAGGTMGQRYYRCVECGEFHQEAIWTGTNGFGHWLGVICPDCGSEIPCLLNVTSWIILARLSPINWILRLLVGQQYQEWEQQRSQRARAWLLTQTETANSTEEPS